MKRYLLFILMQSMLCDIVVAAETTVESPVEHVSLDDVDFGDLTSFDQIPQDIVDKHDPKNMALSDGLRMIWPGIVYAVKKAKNTMAAHIKNNEKAYIIGTACGTFLIIGGIIWYVRS